MTPWGWIRNVYQWRADDILKMTGTDALVFLEFVRLMSISLTVIAIPMCLVLVPVDATYTSPSDESVPQSNSASGRSSQTHDKLLYATIGHVDGPRLWAHVTFGYLATVAILGLIYRSYQKVIRLRQEYFGSNEYQGSYFSRTLMLTDISPDIVTDAALRESLELANSLYKFSEVQLGLSMNNLPTLLSQHKDIVLKLERALDKTLRSHLQNRPLISPDKEWYRCSGTRVDAIDYYTKELRNLEHQIISVRSESEVTLPETYGFASLPNVFIAHSAAHHYSKLKPKDFSVRLAPRPSDIIWSNLTMSSLERQKSRWFARALLLLLFLLNTIPLILAALVSNLEAFASISSFIDRWQHSISFAALTGIVPPLISLTASLILPQIMRKIIIYRGVRTRQSRDLHLTTQYFIFLVLTQFVLFSLISVFLDLALMIKSAIDNNQAATEAVADIITGILAAITHRFQLLSSYWMTWIVLRGYLLLFELAQIRRLVFLLLNRYILPHTPRDIWMFKKPQSFSYWMAYAELLLLTAVGLIYAPLAPIVTAFSAGVFILALIVYKNQLYYVCFTKSETGGRLWSVVVKCLLTLVACMQIILALVVGLLQNWIKAITCIPPVLFVVAFALFCHFKLEPNFRWYTPAAISIDKMQKIVSHSDHQRLERQFGNPFLHQPLSRPIVRAQYMDLVGQLYQGPVISSKYTTEDLLSIPHSTLLPLSATVSTDANTMDDDSVLNCDISRHSLDEAIEMESLYPSLNSNDMDQKVFLNNQNADCLYCDSTEKNHVSDPSCSGLIPPDASTNDSAAESLLPKQYLPPLDSILTDDASLSKDSLPSAGSELDVVNEYVYVPPTENTLSRPTSSRQYRPLPTPPK